MPFADPSLDLQKAIVAVLKADAGVNALIAGRIYDAVPQNAVKPYVSFGPFQLLPEHGDCLDGGESFLQIDAWASGPDSVQVKKLGAALAVALDDAQFALDTQRLVLIEVDQIQYLREPDNITAHAVLTVRAHTDPL